MATERAATQQSRRLPWRWHAISPAIAVLALGCSTPPPEQAVRDQVDAMQQAILQRDPGELEDLLAKDFVGNDGLDRAGARRLAAAVFLRHRQVSARIGPVTVEVSGERDAVARFTLFATGDAGTMLPSQGQVYAVTTGWRLEDGDWRLRHAQWQPRL